MSLGIGLKRVILRNYKSIQACDVRLPPLACLVGPNGAGKSNFVDSLRFVADALRNGVDSALRERGGINEVRRRSGGRPNHFAVGLELDINEAYHFEYEFEIAARPDGRFAVQKESGKCRFRDDSGEVSRHFRVKKGKLEDHSYEELRLSDVGDDRLFLGFGIDVFRHLRKGIADMGFYSLNPDRIRDLQAPDAGDLLSRDGANLASVLGRLQRTRPDLKDRIVEFLSTVVPEIDNVNLKPLGPKETLEFEQISAGHKRTKFLAASMSDGTLRALGVLVALFQSSGGPLLPLVAVEEPEVALHPAAAGVLFDSLKEASERRQVLVTSHSPDLLDRWDLDPNSLLAVQWDEGKTLISTVNPSSRRMLEERLRTPGDLLRMNQMLPDRRRIPRPTTTQGSLF